MLDKNVNCEADNEARSQSASLVAKKQYNTKLWFAIIGVLIFALGFLTAITFSSASLQSNRTATGAISFDLKSPSLSLDNGLKLNCKTVIGANGLLTFGDDSADILLLDSLNLSIDENNQLQYYVKIIYDFSNLAGTVSFLQNAYAYDSAQMSVMTSTSVKNEFYSISSSDGTANSPIKVTKGVSFNVFSFLKDFRYTNNTALKETDKVFKIYVIVDMSSDFNSTSRSQMTIDGIINLNTTALTYESSSVGCSVSFGSGTVTNVTIPYKVKLDSNGDIEDEDIDGSATGDDWVVVTEIQENAFKNCSNLVSISNNGSLLKIGDDAFTGCTSLSQINFDFTKIESVGANTVTQSNVFSDTAFYSSLQPDANGIKKVGDIMMGCSTTSQSTTVTGCRLVAPYAFKGQTSLTSVVIASDVQNVCNYAFMSSSSVRVVDITTCTSTNFDPNAFVNNNAIPLVLKYASGSTVVNTLSDITLFNYSTTINYDQIFSTSTELVNLQYAILLHSQDCSESYTLDTYIVTDKVESFQLTSTSDLAFISSFAPQISVTFNLTQTTFRIIEYWIESINCYYVNNGTNNVLFQTEGGTKNHYTSPVTCNYAQQTLVKNKTNYLLIEMKNTFTACFSGDSKVQLADGTYKLAEDIEYDDLLLTWNMDEGRYSASYPVWISKIYEEETVYTMEFEDGNSLKIIGSHRAFSATSNTFAKTIDIAYSQIGKEFIKVATDASGHVLYDENGEMYNIKSKVTNITQTTQEIMVVNIVTAYQLNNFVDGVLCATGFINMYSCAELGADLKPKYNPEEVHARQTGVDTLYTIDEFDRTVITQNNFQGFRIAELKGVRTILAVTKYIAIDYANACAYPTDDDGNYKYKLSTSDGYSAWITEGDNYTLPEPMAVSGKTFNGWYNNADGKYYQAGDTIAIYVGTHFTACWS